MYICYLVSLTYLCVDLLCITDWSSITFPHIHIYIIQQFVVFTQHGTCRQWLEWLGKQVSIVANQMEAEQRKEQTRMEWLLTATEELEKARNRIQSLEEELVRAKELMPTTQVKKQSRLNRLLYKRMLRKLKQHRWPTQPR